MVPLDVLVQKIQQNTILKNAVLYFPGPVPVQKIQQNTILKNKWMITCHLLMFKKYNKIQSLRTAGLPGKDFRGSKNTTKYNP